MARTAAAVGEFVAAARRRGAERIRIAATSAVARPSTAREFAARVRALTGERVEVISGAEEARLSLLGVAASLPGLRGPFILLDIGGGSTELVLARDRTPQAVVSLRLGVVGLAERFADAGPLDPARFESMRQEVAARLAAEIPEGLALSDAPVVVGTAGSITTLAALDLGLLPPTMRIASTATRSRAPPSSGALPPGASEPCRPRPDPMRGARPRRPPRARDRPVPRGARSARPFGDPGQRPWPPRRHPVGCG